MITNLRWRLADLLSQLANWLRGHKVISLAYDLKGNHAAAIEEDITVRLALATSYGENDFGEMRFTKEEADTLREHIDELATLARAQWWH